MGPCCQLQQVAVFHCHLPPCTINWPATAQQKPQQIIWNYVK